MKVKGWMYQVAAQRSSEYPCADFPLRIKQIILQAIQLAWDDLLAEDILLHSEDEITAALRHLINNIRGDDERLQSFSAAAFETVTQDAKAMSYDAQSLDKMPDLVFRLAGTIDEYNAWFVECKVVSLDRNIGRYIDDGMARFINGGYAWAMPSGVMLAYAKPGYTVESSLTPGCKKKGYVLEVESDFRSTRDIHSTEHERTWCYPDSERSPGPIKLFHLWLGVP